MIDDPIPFFGARIVGTLAEHVTSIFYNQWNTKNRFQSS